MTSLVLIDAKTKCRSKNGRMLEQIPPVDQIDR